MALNETVFKPEQMTTQAAFDGLPAQVVILTNHLVCLSRMDIGATWLSCIVPVNGYRRDAFAKRICRYESPSTANGLFWRNGRRFAQSYCVG